MENNGEYLTAGQARLEQVYLNMPEVRFYFSGETEQSRESVTAWLGQEKLDCQSLQLFSESGESVYYYVLLDVSASISNAEFRGVTEALSGFCKEVREQDHVTFLTFGEEVKVLFDLDGAELTEGGADFFLAELENPDQRTLLFEAVSRMTELAGAVPAEENTRRAAFVITDGEDIAKGKATKDEALRLLQQKSIPVYGFVTQSAKRDSVNAFGEFCRGSGGYLTSLESGQEKAGFAEVRDDLLNSYEAVFLADSNLVSHGTVSVALALDGENGKLQTEVLQDRWMADTAAPAVEELVWESPTQLRVVFSEPVSGADAAENFRLEEVSQDVGADGAKTLQAGVSGAETAAEASQAGVSGAGAAAEASQSGSASAGEGSASARIPAFASPGSDKTSTVLSFSEAPEVGSYRLVCSGIKDISMEENPLEGEAYVEVKGMAVLEEAEEEREASGNSLLFGGIAAAVVLLAAVVFPVLLKRQKKRQGPERTAGADEEAGRVVLPPSGEVRHHVSVEQKQLEEKRVHFHVKGQKEELSVTIHKSMIVGRSSACELIFDDPALSRQHFVLELRGGEVWIQNLSGSGFTKVNGNRLGEKAYRLKSGDEIGAGQLEMTIRW